MKVKLNVKLFLFSIFVILCFLTLMVVSIDIANKKFEDSLHKKELQKMDYLAETLATFYSENGGWSTLKQNIDLWGMLLKSGWADEEASQSERNKRYQDLSVIYHSPIPEWDSMNLGPRICLLDADKKYINGQTKYPIEECTLLPIELSGKAVGWLGLVKGRIVYKPVIQVFKRYQSMIFYIMGSVFFIILIFIVFIFSRFTLMPIKRLAAATKKLGRLDFNTRIPVESSDEIGELAENFNDMAQRLEHYEQNQKQWLMDISHELRTPLSALICEIEALKDGIRKPSKKLISSLSHEIKHIIKLVNDINDISLMETGTFTIKRETVKPLPILSQEAYIFKKRFETNGMSLEVEFGEDDADLQIIGDSIRLKQLFINIIENAIRHSQHPGRLVIRQTRDDGHIKFIFEDSGPGVPDEALPFLFNRLYRVDPSRSRKTGGNGLGLSICKSIVEMHNGKIHARNIQGGGFMIEILLPIKYNSGNSIEDQSDPEDRGGKNEKGEFINC